MFKKERVYYNEYGLSILWTWKQFLFIKWGYKRVKIMVPLKYWCKDYYSIGLYNG